MSEQISTGDFIRTVNGILKNAPPKTYSRDTLSELLSDHYEGERTPQEMKSKLVQLIASLKGGKLPAGLGIPPERQVEQYRKMVDLLEGGYRGRSAGEPIGGDDLL